MLELDAQGFYRAGVALRTMWLAVENALAKHPAESRELKADKVFRDEIRARLAELTPICGALSVPSTSDAIDRLAQDVRKPTSSYRLLMERVRDIEMRLVDDLKRTKIVAIDPSRIAHIDAAAMFGTDVQTKYPSAMFEIDEAGKCFALGRYTASVFHLMRIMEIGVYATSRCLGVPDPIKPGERNWGAILRAVNDAITAKKGTWTNKTDAEFFGGVVLSLDRVRNVWRNSTMHVENKYTEGEAQDVFSAVRAFMKKLASRCDETGQPLA